MAQFKNERRNEMKYPSFWRIVNNLSLVDLNHIHITANFKKDDDKRRAIDPVAAAVVIMGLYETVMFAFPESRIADEARCIVNKDITVKQRILRWRLKVIHYVLCPLIEIREHAWYDWVRRN